VSLAFPVPNLAALPRELAYRPTALAERLMEKAGLLTFGSLLRRIALPVYDALADKSPFACYVALLRHIETHLFPIYEVDEGWFEMSALEGDDPIGILEQDGIPIQLMGVDPWSEGPNAIESPAVAACLCFRSWDRCYQDMTPETFECLAHIRDEPPLTTPFPVVAVASVKPPRGRKWIEPWDKLRDLYAYCHAATGSIFLDNATSAHYDGAENPPWNVDEIEGLARDWKSAHPIVRRINEMRDYIDERPLERVPLMVRVLSRDREALREITLPVRREKMLCDVFARDIVAGKNK